MKRFVASIVVLVGLIGALYFGLVWFFSDLILHPYRSAVEDTPAWLSSPEATNSFPYPSPQTFDIAGADGVQLSGWYFAREDSPNCVVIATHGWGDQRGQMLKWADILWDCGCEVVVYDHRGHGKSGGEMGTGGVKESQDLLAVTDWVQEQTGLTNDRIGWMGVSWGGATVLEAATRRKVAFVMADSPFQDWESAIMERAVRMYGGGINYVKDVVMGMVDIRAGVEHEQASPLLATREIESPVLLIHSRTDSATLSHQSVHLDSALAQVPHVFHHTDWGAGHVGDIDARPLEYRQKVYAFLSEYVEGWGTCAIPLRGEESALVAKEE